MYSALRYQAQKAMRKASCRRRATGGILLASFRSRFIRVVLGVALALGAWVGAATPALAASSTFGYSPGYQYFTVPDGVYSIHFDVTGGSGANGQGTYGGGRGGSGAEVTGDFGVSPGWVLKIWAGGAGQPGGGDGYGNPTHDDFDGGSGGSGYGITTGNGGGGGAASYVVQPTGDIVALAGGGGGGGGGGTSGTAVAGGSDGGYRAPALESNGWDAGAVSGDGTDVYGGTPDYPSNNGIDGGVGGDGFFFGGGGGGGGGGYRTCITGASTLTGTYCFGAGGGGQGGQQSDGGGGGAGGNSYADPSATGVSFTSSGNSPSTAGQITLSYGSPSSTTVSAPSDSSVYGQSVRITAAVDPSDGGGTVTFTSNGIVIPGCANLSFEAGGGSDWLTSCTTSSLSAGTDTIVAAYSGDRSYTGSSSDSTTASVLQARSSTTLHASPSTSISGQPVTFTASVTPTDGHGVVGFSSDGNYIPGCNGVALSASGSDWTASCTTSSLAPGTHAISATYSTDTNYANSNDNTTVTVQQKTSTVLKATPSTLLAQRQDRLIATVASSDGGGTVAFTNNGVTLSSCGAVKLAAVAGGAYQAVCQLAFIAPGTYSIHASYSGDTLSAPSSGSATVQVNPAPAVLSVSPNVGPTAGGQTVTITGYYLTGATKVSFGTTAATNVTVISDSQVTATVPAHASGRVNVTVTSSLGTSAATSTDGYTYDAPPTVSAISPATGPKGTVVTVTGTDLVAGAKVAFGQTAASKVVRVSNTELQATTPAGSGTVPVTVTTAGGTSASVPGGQFTFSGS